MNGFLVLLEVFVKLVIGICGGAGVGMLVFGLGLVKQGVTNFSYPGPPPGPTFIGVGGGLLAGAVIMLVLFVGPFSRRWFVPSNVNEPPKKWNV